MRRFLLALVLLLAGLPAAARADGLIPDLDEAQIRKARPLIESFKTDPRGPFYRIRWFCNDGTDHPPAPPPCRDRGGGYQHASLSPAVLQLAKWNIDVGTILAGKSFDELFDAGRDHHRLKQLVLESYLEDVDQGWIYRRAYSYRGARQIEDEEQAGYRFLTQLLSNADWVGRHYYLVNQLITVIPHGLPDSVIKKARTLAKSIADQDPRFQEIRAKIHSSPGDNDLAMVRRFLSEKQVPEPVEKLLLQLGELLEQERAGRRLSERLPAIRRRLSESPLLPLVENLALALQGDDPQKVFASGAALTFKIREVVTASQEGRRNLELLDFNAVIQELGFGSATKRPRATRHELVEDLLNYSQYAVGVGLLSMRQFHALRGEIESLQGSEIEPEAYYAKIHYLARVPEWCRATVTKDLGPVTRLYQPVEPLAASLIDHLLRSSVALPLSARVEELVSDANRAVGIRHSIFGETSGRGVVGLNPGAALGRLFIIRSHQEAGGEIDPNGIYVIPETVSDLKPMAGVFTLDSGNMLSHAQLLAANLGIPNARIPSALLPLFESHDGKEILFAVTPRGVVVVREKASLTPEERKIWIGQPTAAPTRVHLDTSRLDLSSTEIVRLSNLRREDSGVTVGPKAANLGQLANDFPGRVAEGLVLPFGVYYQHIQRTLPGDSAPLAEQISSAYAEAERLRAEGAAITEISRFIHPRLAEFRTKIQNMPFLPEFEKELIRRLQYDFDWPDGSRGVFIRSDTNAEDLPQFTGAGLNLTVPNQVGTAQILQAIKNVWASPFSERAYEWRSRALIGSDQVYPSVILMRAVPVDKSGVIATVNLETGNMEEITVNVSEGVSAVVDGGVAESLLLRSDGGVQLLQQARASYRKQCSLSGGFENLPVIGDDYLLTPAEIVQVRSLVAEVKQKYRPARAPNGDPLPWDIEFGFERGELKLFQIRLLVRYLRLKTLEALVDMEQQPDAQTVSMVRLDQPL